MKRFSVWHRYGARYWRVGVFGADQLDEVLKLMRTVVAEFGGEAQLFVLGSGPVVRRWTTYPEVAA